MTLAFAPPGSPVMVTTKLPGGGGVGELPPQARQVIKATAADSLKSTFILFLFVFGEVASYSRRVPEPTPQEAGSEKNGQMKGPRQNIASVDNATRLGTSLSRSRSRAWVNVNPPGSER